MQGIQRFSEQNFRDLCNSLAHRDAHLQKIIHQYSYPPMWSRPASFETLIHIILEQQVSLASAKAALEKLREKIVKITPENLLVLTDEELRACYFSRQKTGYARHLAQSIVSGALNLKKLSAAPDDII
ncbi:MAG TPA: hypothetical protein VLD19_04370, partial [Chitinophagaceae bacterium]|nr:hypothetical protein [Chitinophagaceae bacterium]